MIENVIEYCIRNRFLVLMEPKDTPQPPLTVVVNWQAAIPK